MNCRGQGAVLLNLVSYIKEKMNDIFDSEIKRSNFLSRFLMKEGSGALTYFPVLWYQIEEVMKSLNILCSPVQRGYRM